nr:putative chromo domain-containing protein lhp1 [Quercus suber]
MELESVPSDLPTLGWVGSERKACYAAYEMRVRITDDHGVSRTMDFIAYGVDREGSALLLGMHTLRKYGVNLDYGPSRRPDYYTENQAVQTLLPSLQRKLAVVNEIRALPISGARGSTTENCLEADSETLVARICSASLMTPAAGATDCNQCVPRYEARVLVSELAKEDPAEGVLGILAAQQRDAFVVQRRALDTSTQDNHHSKGERSWRFDQNGVLRFKGRIYVPPESSIRQELLKEHYDHIMAGHFGADPSEDRVAEGEIDAAITRVKRMSDARRVLEAHLQTAQEHQQRWFNQNHRPMSFKRGDLVLLSTKNLKLAQPARKLSPKFREGDPGPDTQAPALVDEHDEELWEVESLVNHRTAKGQKQYLVRWKGYSEVWDTWLNSAELDSASELRDEYDTRLETAKGSGERQTQPTKAKPTGRLRGRPRKKNA